ncbi:MAG TPA: hypothetical protein VM490_21345, partial [Armatimonadaceae bacterium]|nr:hypothetical protein [Armatimonadaceae bacterium]
MLVGTVRVPNVRIQDAPAIRDVSARVTYAGGVVALRDVTARAEGGGRLAGRATLRVAERGPGGRGLKVLSPDRIVAAFEGTAEDVSLATLPVGNLPREGALRLAGRGDADFAGRMQGGKLTAAANVKVDGLRVGDVPFSTAVARVQTEGGSFVLTAARLVSPAGTAFVRGDVDPSGSLSLDFLLNGLDLGRFGAALGVPELDGFVSAAGSVTGSVAQPRVLVRSLGGMNLRYRTFAADTVTARNVLLTRQGVTLSPKEGEQLTVHRYPAEVAVTGRVSGLTTRTGAGGGGRIDPVLDLVATVRRLDYQEVLRQLPQQARDRVQDTVRSSGANRPAAQTGGEAAPFGGSVRYATIGVQGRATDPVIRGDVWLGRLVVAGYPLGRTGPSLLRPPRAPGEAAQPARIPTSEPNVRFAYRDGQISLTDVRIAASVGEVTGKATITRSGYVYGQFGGTDLDLGPLTYLTKSVASLSGKVNLSGYFSGTRERPVVTVNLAPSDISVAGTPLSDVTVADLRYIANLSQNQARVELREASFQQSGTTVSVGRTSYDIKSRRLNTSLSVDTGDVGVLLEALRRSGIVDTPAGARFVAALNDLPYPIEGKFPVMEVTFSGRVGKKVEDVNATARLRAEGLRVGTFVASQFSADATMKGDLVTLEQVTVTSGDTTFLARGKVNLQDKGLDLSIDSNDEASLDLVRAFSPTFPVRGKVSLNALVRGTYERPEVLASVTGTDLLFVLTPTDKDVARAAEASEARIAEAARQGNVVTDPDAVAPEREALQQ